VKGELLVDNDLGTAQALAQGSWVGATKSGQGGNLYPTKADDGYRFTSRNNLARDSLSLRNAKVSRSVEYAIFLLICLRVSILHRWRVIWQDCIRRTTTSTDVGTAALGIQDASSHLSHFRQCRMLAVFCVINLINYVDRGAIASNGVNGRRGNSTCLPAEECFRGYGIQ
jgi:hypothetical protein